jgi:hypothetical protein
MEAAVTLWIDIARATLAALTREKRIADRLYAAVTGWLSTIPRTADEQRAAFKELVDAHGEYGCSLPTCAAHQDEEGS